MKEKDNYHLRYELAGADETITNLKEQLAEKDIRIEELEGQFAYECECNMQLVELQKQLAEKDKEINSLIVDYEKRISQEQELMSNLEKRIAEKDKEIEEILSSKKHFKTCAENMLDVLKTINSLLPKPQENGLNYKKVADDVVVLIKEKDKEIEKLKQQYTILENENGKLTTELIMGKYKKAQKEVSFGMQLAIQELEKVKEWLEPKYFDYEQINYLTRIIDNQIKELKGE